MLQCDLALFVIVSTVVATLMQVHMVTGVLQTKLLTQGSRLQIVYTGGGVPMETHEHLSLIGDGRTQTVSTLANLKGRVAIRSSSAALEFVRLRTSPSTWYLWPGSRTVEVVSDMQARELPNFGRRSDAGSGTGSGYMGILSKVAFMHGDFAPARVVPSGNTYVVTRWILTEAGRALVVQQVRETIGPSGEYGRRTLNSHSAPVLPNTFWTIPKFE